MTSDELRRGAGGAGALVLALSVAWVGCDGGKKAGAPPSQSSVADAPAASAPTPPTRLPAAERIVAIGDLHGDLAATKAALRLAKVMDDGGHWSGDKTVVVQTGDILDRGDGEEAILDLFATLAKEADPAGGRVVVLNGNHELMNVAGDFRYVTPGGFRDFEDAPGVGSDDPRAAAAPPEQRARLAAFLPGAHYARKFASQPVVLVVGDNVFAHGGVLPKHVRYGIERLNRETAAWLLGRGNGGMSVVNAPDSPVWSRHFSDEPDASDCELLAESLKALEAKRMVVGHTPQRRIASACDAQVWRIDVGMSAHYGGKPEVLEIVGDSVRALGEP
jgi:hypothetical protein